MAWIKVRIVKSEEADDGALRTAAIRRLETDSSTISRYELPIILHALAKIGTQGTALYDSADYQLCDVNGNELFAK